MGRRMRRERRTAQKGQQASGEAEGGMDRFAPKYKVGNRYDFQRQ